MVTVRIAVCGDEGCGKSSLITSLVKDTFVSSKIQAVLPQITIPPTLGTPDNVTTVIVDTLFHNLPVRRKELEKNIKREYNKVLQILNAYACISVGVKFSVSNQIPKGSVGTDSICMYKQNNYN